MGLSIDKCRQLDQVAMGMMDEMAWYERPGGKGAGDEFDKAFIEQMIMHHQGALDMAAPGERTTTDIRK